MPEESCRNLEKVVFKGLSSTTFQLLCLLQLFPESHDFSVVGVELQGLFYMLLTKVCLPIVEQNTTSPEQKYGAIHELLLTVICKLQDLTQVIWRVQYSCLDPHFDVLD